MIDANANAPTAFGVYQCPLPNTHQRLRQAHLLWHQSSENYQDVDRFLTNVNSLIQELRNVTFILQSEKSRFPNFENWYRPWQERLRHDKDAKWLKDARNLVVKQGTLAAASRFNVRILTYDSIEVVSLLSEKDLSISTVLTRKDFNSVVATLRRAMEGQGDAVLAIERCWSTPDLMGCELLEVLGAQYGLLASMVLDAHVYLGHLDCASAGNNALDSDFPAQRDRSHMLPCMMREQAARTDFFTLSKLERIVGEHRPSRFFPVTEEDIKWRYQFAEADNPNTFDALDPLKIYDRLVYSSKKMLRKDRSLARLIHLRDGRGQWTCNMITARNRVEKYLLMHSLAQTVREEGCDALLEVAEAWIFPKEYTKTVLMDAISQVPGKHEAISVHLATRDGLTRTARTMFKRGPLGGIKFSDTEESDGEKRYDLAPIYRVWYEQNQFELAKGTRIPVWQPELSSPCLCGGDKPYGVCCLPILEGVDGPLQNSDELLDAGEIDRAERHARAYITRYARWVRQQTAFSLNSSHREFSEELIPIDAQGLEACFARLERWATRAGNHDAVTRAYRSLEQVVGVPVIARRLTALGSRWLIRNGRIEEGLLELGRLGKAADMADTEALILSVRYDDHEPQEEIRLLRLAVRFALSDGESYPALFLLAHKLSENDLRSEALASVDEVLKKSNERQTISTALVLKWSLSGDDEDFQKLVGFMQAAETQEERRSAAAILISRNREEAGLDLLKPLLDEGDPAATLLAVECEVRTGKCADAAERLRSMEVNASSPQRIQSGYALVHGMLVIECRREDLRKMATQLVRDALSVELVPSLVAMLEALTRDGLSSR